MGCLGVHFALDEKTVQRLKTLESDEERLDYVQEEIEESFLADHREWCQETDKAWDAIHRSLTDGQLEWENGTYPLNHTILGGEILCGEDDYIMSLKTPAQVQDTAAALQQVSQPEFRAAYFRMDACEYGFPLSEEDFEYTWEWFEQLKPWFARAATAGRYVLFTASQ
jgi:hypothetical protein